MYGIGQGDGGPVFGATVAAGGLGIASGFTRQPGRFVEQVYGVNAGLVLVERTRIRSNGLAGRPRLRLMSLTGTALRSVTGVPTGWKAGCGAPMRCWPLPDRRTLVWLNPARGRVSRIDLVTGKVTRLASLSSTWPDAQEASFGGVMSPGSHRLFVNDKGSLTAVAVRTGAKTVLATASGGDHWFDMRPFCVTGDGRVLVSLEWYEGDPGMPPMGAASVDPVTGKYTRLVTWDQVEGLRGVFGCTADGQALVVSATGYNSDADSWESWVTVSASDGRFIGLGGNRNTNLTGPYVDNGVGR